jgi:hypothetical protein
MKSNLYLRSLTVIAAICTGITVNAQKLDKDVKVVQPYEPSLSEAHKINVAPVIDDTVRVNPVVNYWIHTRRIDAAFEPKPISAAKLVPEPLPRLHNNYLKLGYGNYYTPLAEVCITNGRDRKATYGLFVNYQGSNGKVKLDNGDAVSAGYSNLHALLFGSKFYKKSTLSADVFADQNERYFYGYNPKFHKDLNKSDIRQTYKTAGLNLRYYSSGVDSSHLVYDLGGHYTYFGDKFNNTENNVKLNASLGTEIIPSLFAGANVQIDHFSRKFDALDSTANMSYFTFDPYLSRSSDEWSFKIGLHTVTDFSGNKSQANVYPEIGLKFVVVKGILEPYLGITGNYNYYSYRTVAAENAYVQPGLAVKSADERVNFYGGFKGKMSDHLSYDVNGSYAKINSAHFYVNAYDTDSLFNHFNVVYDDIKRSRISLEISYQPDENLNIRGQVAFNSYQTFNEEKAWNMPSFESFISARYNIENKLLFDASLVVIGKRYAKPIKGTEAVTLNPVASLNLGAEYRYTKAFSLFLTIRNLANMKYYEWNQYPSQRIMAMLGFTYSF